MLFKFGESVDISEVYNEETILLDPQIEENFGKFASKLKQIAPKAKDFLYFSAIMMHSAEASLVDDKGAARILSNGSKAEAHWEKKGESIKWVSNDPSIKPYKNNNSDIFPEQELLKAYKNWVGKPLCIDHKSNSVDHIRGVIIDTYYDRIGKRVIALCALDKVSFPELARKVASGYATCVSMGTAVGRAVCTDCGTVARAENDFCVHMRTKSGYGEINLDLQPIELSIVVNGADPRAKIREIVASVNYLNNYADKRQQDLLQAEASLSEDKITEIKEKIVQEIEKGLDSLIKEFESSVKSKENEDKDAADSLSTASEEMAKAASLVEKKAESEDNDVLKQKFNELKSEIQTKLAKIEEDFDNFIRINGSRDNTMADKKAYFQGAGGVNEPTPGQPKYEKDPMAERVRNSEDKQMFEDDLGPVDGLHPGPASVGMNELDRKKMLARAEYEERSVRRKQALSAAKQNLRSNAYHQGTEEPSLGKPKYPKEDSDKIRDKEDKQMTGQAPFPGVGKVDGLHPSPASVQEKDELKRKEMLSRAGLKAKFVKAADSQGNVDRAKSQWQVFANDKLVLSASVHNLSAGRVEALYGSIATRDFGTKMLEKVREVGIDKAASLFTYAQDAAMPTDPTAMPAAPAAPAPAAAPAPSLTDAKADADGDGGPASTIKGLVEEVKNTLSDIEEELSKLDEVNSALKEEAPAAPAAEMPAVTASLQKMRVELNAALVQNITKCASELSEHREEMELIEHLYDTDSVNDSNHDYVEAIASDALAEAKTVLAGSRELLQAFVKYARGTESLIKRAEVEETHAAYDADDSDAADSEEADADDLDAMDAEISELYDLMNDDSDSEHSDEEDHDHSAHSAYDKMSGEDGEDKMSGEDEMCGDDEVLATLPEDEQAAASFETNLSDLMKGDGKVKLTMAGHDLSTREGRQAYRTKLAADSMKVNPLLGEAHKLLDHKSDSGELGEVETVEEVSKKMHDIALAPVKVRKDAEEILALVKAGKLSADEVDHLEAHGADPAAIKYFKQLWKDVEGGSEYASDLLAEFKQAKAGQEIETYKVKLARAYDLAYQMVDRGLCSREHSAVGAQVEEIMKFNDDSFDSLKRVVARHAPTAMRKEASLPRVGLFNSEEVSASSDGDDLNSALSKAFSGRRY